MMHHGNQTRTDLFTRLSFGGGGCGCGGGSSNAHDPNVQGIGYDMWCMPQTDASQNIQNQMARGAAVGAAVGSLGGPHKAAIGAVGGAMGGAVGAIGDNAGWW
jgi:hypothetical protein